MIRRVKEGLIGYEKKVDYVETLVESNEHSQSIKFRGSPTLLINGKDLEGREEAESVSLNCRIYEYGLPSVVTIKECIIRNL